MSDHTTNATPRHIAVRRSTACTGQPGWARLGNCTAFARHGTGACTSLALAMSLSLSLSLSYHYHYHYHCHLHLHWHWRLHLHRMAQTICLQAGRRALSAD